MLKPCHRDVVCTYTQGWCVCIALLSRVKLIMFNLKLLNVEQELCLLTQWKRGHFITGQVHTRLVRVMKIHIIFFVLIKILCLYCILLGSVSWLHLFIFLGKYPSGCVIDTVSLYQNSSMTMQELHTFGSFLYFTHFSLSSIQFDIQPQSTLWGLKLHQWWHKPSPCFFPFLGKKHLNSFWCVPVKMIILFCFPSLLRTVF